VTAPAHPIAIAVALRDEERALERIIERGLAERPGRGTVSGRPVILARTGMGAERAREGVAALLERERPGAILVAGYAGALRPGLRPGDVLVAREVMDGGEDPRRDGPRLPDAAPDARLLEAASRVRIETGRVIVGRLVSVERVLSSAAAKRQAGESSGADACDMESHAALGAAGERGVPALAARAIVDEWDLDLPFDLGKLMTEDGRLRPFTLLRAAATSPRGALRLPALGARARRASASLAAFTRAFVALAGEPAG
jgi:nucleoside phosphorylase